MLKYFATGMTFISLFFACDAEEMFTAITHLSTLQKTHKSVVQSLDNYVNMELKRLRILTKFLISFTKEQQKMDENLEYVKNPINAFALINRMTAEMEKIEQFTKEISRFEKPCERFPTNVDLEGAAVGMWRLQSTYDLNISQLVAGELSGDFSEDKKPFIEKTSPLTANECFEVGRIAFGEQDYESAILWMKYALEKYTENAPQNVHLLNASIIVEYISKSYIKTNDFVNARLWKANLFEPHNDNNHIDTYSKRQDDEINKYNSICRGRIVMTEDKKRRLHCYYKSSSAFLRLARVRTELLHQDPAVYLFHNIISDKEIRNLRHISRPLLKRAVIFQNRKGDDIPEDTRISKSVWLKDDISEVVTRITQRVEDLTGIPSIYGEMLQVSNYGVGGHFVPHYDALASKDHNCELRKRIDRVATLMFYLSNVEQGGATVFLEMNLTVFPIKNAAISWLNMLPSGEIDVRTLHGACPVLRGSKWVATKWLH